MARPNKVAAVAEVREAVDAHAATLVVHYRGLTVADLAKLRGELRIAGATFRIVKNTLARRAVQDAGIEGLVTLLTGPTALAYCADDPVGPSKILEKFAKDHPEVEVKGGYLDGQVLDAASAQGLAAMASRDELLSQMAGLMQGALSGMARLLVAQTEHMARLIQALVDKTPGEAPEEAAPDEATPEPEAAPKEATPEPEAAPEAAAEEKSPDAADDTEPLADADGDDEQDS